MKHILTPPFLTTSFSENCRKAKKRINGILDLNKKKTGAAAFLMIIILTVLCGGCVALNKPTSQALPEEPVVVIGKDTGGNSDIILVCTWHGEENSFDILQIPRDTRTASGVKMREAYSDGRLLSELDAALNIKTDKFIEVDFNAFRQLVNSVGGVDFNVPLDMNYSDPYQELNITLEKGEQTLDGSKAEMLIRFRKNNEGVGYANGDIDRLSMQKSFYASLINKLITSEISANTLDNIIKSLKTNLTDTEMKAYIQLIPKITVESINIHLLSGHEETIDNISYYIADDVQR